MKRFDLDEDIQEYNRKTIAYGDGSIEIITYRNPKYKLSGFDRGGRAHNKSIITDEEQEKRTQEQLFAIRRTIKGITRSNEFRYFITLTFDPKRTDSKNYDEVIKKLQNFLRSLRRKKKFKYLIVVEPHKSGAFHLHCLIGEAEVKLSEAKNKKGKPIIRHGRQVYNLENWKWGYSSCEEIEDQKRTSSYISKYISKDLLNNKEMFRRKRYFCSQGLKRPEITYELHDNDDLKEHTPNFGIVETDEHGNNHLNIGIYNLSPNEETGVLEQSKDYLIKAKKDPQLNAFETTVKGHTDTKE